MDLNDLGIVNFIGKRYGTFNPFIVAKRLNIPVIWCDLGDNLMGKVSYLKGRPIILLNESFEFNNSRYFYCAHELSHAIWQEGLTGAYNLNTRFRSKFEQEATKYAIYILINLYNEDNDEFPDTYHVIEVEYGVPKL